MQPTSEIDRRRILALFTRWEQTESAPQAPTSDEELVERARRRDASAWSQIFDSHYGDIYRYARARIFDDDAAAEDLASSVFVEAIASIESFEYRGKPLLVWLYRIARNLVVNHQRKTLSPRGRVSDAAKSLGRHIVSRLDSLSSESRGRVVRDELVATDDPSELAAKLDLREAIQHLPDQQREVVALRYLVGLSTPEIGETMGKSASAVYSLEARALNSLRRRMK